MNTADASTDAADQPYVAVTDLQVGRALFEFHQTPAVVGNEALLTQHLGVF